MLCTSRSASCLALSIKRTDKLTQPYINKPTKTPNKDFFKVYRSLIVSLVQTLYKLFVTLNKVMDPCCQHSQTLYSSPSSVECTLSQYLLKPPECTYNWCGVNCQSSFVFFDPCVRHKSRKWIDIICVTELWTKLFALFSASLWYTTRIVQCLVSVSFKSGFSF